MLSKAWVWGNLYHAAFLLLAGQQPTKLTLVANPSKFLACLAITFGVLLLLAIFYESHQASNSKVSDSNVCVLLRTPHCYIFKESSIPSVPQHQSRQKPQSACQTTSLFLARFPLQFLAITCAPAATYWQPHPSCYFFVNSIFVRAKPSGS